MPFHALKIKQSFQNHRIFTLLYLLSLDYYCRHDNFDKCQPVLNASPTLLDLDALVTLQHNHADPDLAGYQFPVRLKNRSDIPVQIVSVASNT